MVWRGDDPSIIYVANRGEESLLTEGMRTKQIFFLAQETARSCFEGEEHAALLVSCSPISAWGKNMHDAELGSYAAKLFSCKYRSTLS